ncbi:MAG TPA: hypothetical protein VMC03_19075 [Streptosporangiaceae bacterium]|nr:hypothetical protein [Streptosporangiaceae bacterium]
MTTSTANPDKPAAASSAPFSNPFDAPARLWMRAAFLLAGAAQLITISALVSADPEPNTWAMLLLAVAPVFVVAAAAFTRAPVNMVAAVVALVVLVVGLVGAAAHTGWFFAPAIAALAVGAVKLWRERA